MSYATGNRITRTIVVVWLTLSIASVVLAALTWRQLSHRLAEAREAAAIQDEVEGVLKLLLDAETGQRGFTIREINRSSNRSTPANTNSPNASTSSPDLPEPTRNCSRASSNFAAKPKCS